jgi:hypothetical protein
MFFFIIFVTVKITVFKIFTAYQAAKEQLLAQAKKERHKPS